MTEFTAIEWTTKIIALAVLLQSIELIQLRHSYSDRGVWQWQIISQEFARFPKALRIFIEFTLSTPNFNYLLVARAIAALLLLATTNFLLVAFLLVSTILIGLRWRGVFNGGSDYMTIVVLSALTAVTLFPASKTVAIGALCYVAIQSCSSYFVSGIVKAKSKNWLTGLALPAFISSGAYVSPNTLCALLRKRALAVILSWLAIAFELAFPTALFNPELALIFICGGLLFHATNFYIFGLNRFLFAWAATYPAIYYCSQWAYN